MGNDPSLLATLEPICNGVALLCVIAALVSIRRRKTELHRRLMLGAIAASAAFLICYLTRHALQGTVYYTGPPGIRPLYLGVLVSHSLLAVAALPLILRTAFLGLRERHAAHRRIARLTAPLWLYISSTGLLIFYLLYGV